MCLCLDFAFLTWDFSISLSHCNEVEDTCIEDGEVFRYAGSESWYMGIIIFFPAFSIPSINLSFLQWQNLKKPQQTTQTVSLFSQTWSSLWGRWEKNITGFCVIPTFYKSMTRILGLICSGSSELETFLTSQKPVFTALCLRSTFSSLLLRGVYW